MVVLVWLVVLNELVVLFLLLYNYCRSITDKKNVQVGAATVNALPMLWQTPHWRSVEHRERGAPVNTVPPINLKLIRFKVQNLELV